MRGFAESFSYYQLGNALKRSESKYRAESSRTTRVNKSKSAPLSSSRHAEAGRADPDPIFIVGLPRSGSTLLEQILASHSQVEGTQELANIQQIVQTLRGRDPELDNPRYPQILTQMTPPSSGSSGRSISPTPASTAPPNPPAPRSSSTRCRTFPAPGLIHLMLPNAKIIDARRERWRAVSVI